MTDVLNKDEFEREWNTRKEVVEISTVAPPTVFRFMFHGFLEALIGFDDIIGQAPTTPAHFHEVTIPLPKLGRINPEKIRQIKAPVGKRRRLLK